MHHQLEGIFPETVFRLGPVEVSNTIVYTWLAMAFLIGLSAAITRSVSLTMSPGQNVLEMVVEWLLDTIEGVVGTRPERFLPLVGTLALFLAVANTMSVVPGLRAPTNDLSTTTALALIVFVAVPVFGIRERGVRGYLAHYLEPTPVLLPLNLITELSRTLALAVRLFGNVMSTELIVAVLIVLAGVLVPVPLMALSLLTGLVQAYIFAVLALVFIGAAIRPHGKEA